MCPCKVKNMIGKKSEKPKFANAKNCSDQEGLFKCIASADPDKEEKDDNTSDSCQSSTNSSIPIQEIKEYIDKEFNLQTDFLNYLDNSQNIEENYKNLCKVIENISKDPIELTNFLQFISSISINHQRFPNFFSKIEKVLTLFKEEMKE